MPGPGVWFRASTRGSRFAGGQDGFQERMRVIYGEKGDIGNVAQSGRILTAKNTVNDTEEIGATTGETD